MFLLRSQWCSHCLVFPIRLGRNLSFSKLKTNRQIHCKESVSGSWESNRKDRLWFERIILFLENDSTNKPSEALVKGMSLNNSERFRLGFTAYISPHMYTFPEVKYFKNNFIHMSIIFRVTCITKCHNETTTTIDTSNFGCDQRID